MHAALASITLALVAGSAIAGGEGLVAQPDRFDGARWQARIEVDSAMQPTVGNTALGHAGSIQTTRLLGDYRLDALRFGQTSGLTLTSGLVLSQRTLGAGADSRSAWPYLGLGYAGSAARGDFSFSADVGLAAQSLGSTARLGRLLNGGVSLDDAWRGLQLQPMVRLGVNYSF